MSFSVLESTFPILVRSKFEASALPFPNGAFLKNDFSTSYFLHVAVQCRFTSLLLLWRFCFFRVEGGLAHRDVPSPRGGVPCPRGSLSRGGVPRLWGLFPVPGRRGLEVFPVPGKGVEGCSWSLESFSLSPVVGPWEEGEGCSQPPERWRGGRPVPQILQTGP